MHRFLLILFSFFSLVGSSQLAYDWVYHPENTSIEGGTFEAVSTIADSSGFVYVLGEFKGTADFDPSSDTLNLTSVVSGDVYLSKYDSLGNYVWAFRIGSIHTDNATKLLVDQNGDILISGEFEGTLDFDPSLGLVELNSSTGKDAFIAKYSNTASLIWALNYGNTDDVTLTSLCQDEDNGIIAIGSFSGADLDADPTSSVNTLYSSGGADTYCINLSENGAFNWAFNIGGIGASHACYGYSIIRDHSNNLCISGSYSGTVDFDPGSGISEMTFVGPGSDAFMAKFETDGSLIWSKTFNGTSTSAVRSVAFDSINNLYLVGDFGGTVDFDPSPVILNKTTVGPSYSDIFISKFNPDGELIWNTTSGVFDSDYARSVATDDNGNVFVGGNFGDEINLNPADGRVFLACYTTNLGSLVWAKQSQSAIAAEVYYKDHSVYTCGRFNDSVFFDPPANSLLVGPYSTPAGFFAKYETFGNNEWANLIGGYTDDSIANESIKAFDFKATGNIIMAGHFTQHLLLDPQEAGMEVTSNHEEDIFMVELTPDNHVVWSKRIGGNNDDKVSGLFVDENDYIYICGTFRDTIDFDSSGIAAPLISAGSIDAFIAKFNPNGDLIWVKAISGPDLQFISMTRSDDNFIYTSGIFSGLTDFDPSTADFNLNGGLQAMYFAKYSTDGDFMWAKKVGLSSSISPTKPILTGDTLITMTGWFTGTVDFDPNTGTVAATAPSGNLDVFVAKYDSSGNFISLFSFGGNQSEFGNSLIYDEQGNWYLTGGFNGTCNFNPLGSSVSIVSQGQNDIFFAKYNPLNQLLFVKVTGGTSNDYGKTILMDAQKNIWQTGSFSSTIDFDPGSGVSNLISVDGYDGIFIRKLDTLGNHIWSKRIDGFGLNVSHELAIKDSNEFYLAADFSHITDVDPSENVQEISTLNGNDTYILKLNPCLVSYSSIDTTVCGPFFYAAEFLTTSGSFEFTYVNAAGCDSILTINLTVLNSYSYLDTSVCHSYTTPSGNNIINADGIYTDTLINFVGCDSIIIINLNILSSFSSQAAVACSSYESPSGNFVWSTSGVFTDTLINQFNCDSIITIDLVVNSNSTNTINPVACDSFLSPAGNTYTTSGTYNEIIPTVHGCDSVLTINLTVNSVDVSTTLNSVSITANNSAAVNYQWLNCDNGFSEIPGETNQTFTAISNGNYAVIVTENGCSDTSACVNINGLALNQNPIELFELYPNPVSDELTILFSENFRAEEIMILNCEGKLVREQKISDQSVIVFNVSDLAPGIYTVNLISNDNINYQKLIKL